MLLMINDIRNHKESNEINWSFKLICKLVKKFEESNKTIYDFNIRYLNLYD